MGQINEMAEVKLTLYKPHPLQLEFHQSNHRYRIFSTGRQAGKSTACLNDLVFKAWNNPKTYYWMISPIYSQAKEQYRRMIKFLPVQVIKRKSDTELRIDFINGSTIEFKSGEVLDRLRGSTLHGVIIDEVRDQHKDLWPLVIRPMLAVTGGWAAFASTPNGFDQFYDLFQQAETDPDWKALSAPSTCNPLFTQSEFEAARKQMSESEFAQEILAEFRDMMAGKAYRNHGSYNQTSVNPFARNGEKLSLYLPIVVGLDFNVNPMCWTLGQTNGHKIHFFDEIVINDTNTHECAPELLSRVLSHPPGVILIGDSTGESRNTKAKTGDSDYSIIMELFQANNVKIENRTPSCNPGVKDRVNQVNTLLLNSINETALTYDPVECPNLKKDFDRVVWKVGASSILDQTKDPSLTHSSDGVGYVCCELFDTWKPSPGLLRVIRR